MSGAMIVGLPSKGRLMEDTILRFKAAGLTVQKLGNERGYRGEIVELPGVDVAFLSASEIALQLRAGKIHFGVTGEDLVREHIQDVDRIASFIAPLGFGHADVVVAVPAAWIDCQHMRDLEDVAAIFKRVHGRRMRVATKYMNLTRAFFTRHHVVSYQIIESLGATEGTPAAGTAELIVDITSTGETLRANHLRVLDGGVMLRSEANLVRAKRAAWRDVDDGLRDAFAAAFGGQPATA